MNEHDLALREACAFDAAKDYFIARPGLDTPETRRVFDAAFERGREAEGREAARLALSTPPRVAVAYVWLEEDREAAGGRREVFGRQSPPPCPPYSDIRPLFL